MEKCENTALCLPATSQQGELCALHAYGMLGNLECIAPEQIGMMTNNHYQ